MTRRLLWSTAWQPVRTIAFASGGTWAVCNGTTMRVTGRE
jgi:hypothetical protein